MGIGTVPVVGVEGIPNSVTHAGSSTLTKSWGTVILGKAFGDIRLARVNDMPVNRPDGKNGYQGDFLSKLQKDDFSVFLIGNCLLCLIAFLLPNCTKG